MMAMNFDEFCAAMQSAVSEQLMPQYGEVTTKLNRVHKENLGMRTGLSIQTDKNPLIAPVIYLDDLYEEYIQNGKSPKEIMKDFDKVFERALGKVAHMKDQTDFFSFDVTDWESAKKYVAIHAVGVSRNEELLSRCPHREYGDIALMYQLQASKGKDERVSVKITNDLMNHYGISEKDLNEAAIRNSVKHYPVRCALIGEVLKEMMDFESDSFFDPEIEFKDNSLYVLTNEQKMGGASVIFYPDVLDKIGEKIPEGFYIIPSSIHEVLIISRNSVDKAELENMVYQINRIELSPEEVLSDCVSEYDSLSRTVQWGQVEEKTMDFAPGDDMEWLQDEEIMIETGKSL